MSVKQQGDGNRIRQIDGLRGIALLGVLLYHARVEKLFPGGFLGVDIFFVISGYVITLSLYRKLRHGDFNMWSFMRRRIYRLVPALLVVILISNSICTLIFVEDDRLDVALLSIFSTVSLSNILLWMQSGYFDTSALTKPYLHTWSLSVEWHFYLSWAPLASLIYTRISSSRVQITFLSILAVLSVGATQVTLKSHETAAFYNVIFRYSEFLCGAIPAWYSSSVSKANENIEGEHTDRRSTMLLSSMANPCFALILLQMLLFTENYPFPGLSALPICVCTVVVITNDKKNGSNCLLSHPMLQWLGAISYSVYLVHWPILVFLHYIMLSKESATIRVACLMTSICIGHVLNNCIEKRFQEESSIPSKSVKKAAISTLFTLVIVQSVIMGTRNLPIGPSASKFAQIDPQLLKRSWKLQSMKANQVVIRNNLTCHGSRGYEDNRNFEKCNPASDNEVLLVGDSHASDLWYALNESLANVTVIQLTGDNCKLGMHPLPPHCRALSYEAGTLLRRRAHRIRAAIVVTRWKKKSGEWPNVRPFIRYLRDELQIDPVFLLGPRPEFAPKPLLTLELARDVDLKTLKQRFRESRRIEAPSKMVAATAKILRAQFVDVFQLMCQSKSHGTLECPVLTEDHRYLMYSDCHHYNVEGARLFVKRFLPMFEATMEKCELSCVKS